MMKRRIAAFAAAGLIAITAAPAAFADPEDEAVVTQAPEEETPGVYTTTTPPPGYDPTKTAGNAVTSFVPFRLPDTSGTPTAAMPTAIWLEQAPGKDGEIEVSLNVKSDQFISELQLGISFNKDELEYLGSTTNDANTKGETIVRQDETTGDLSLKFSRAGGTDFNGKYLTMRFKMPDPEKLTTVIYLNVTSFKGQKGNELNYASENGIITNPDAVQPEPEPDAIDPELRVIDIPMTDQPLALADYGLIDVKYCLVSDTEILTFDSDKSQISLLKPGMTKLELTYLDNSIERLYINVTESVDESVLAEEANAPVEEGEITLKTTTDNSKKRNLLIIIAVIVGVAALIAEYIAIMKPFGKKSGGKRRDYDEDEEDYYDDEDFEEEPEDEDEPEEDQEEEAVPDCDAPSEPETSESEEPAAPDEAPKTEEEEEAEFLDSIRKAIEAKKKKAEAEKRK